MSWLFSQALAAEFWEGSFSDGEPCAQLNVMPTARPFWRNDKTKDSSNLSRYGLTSKLLTEHDGEGLLTSFLAGFRAKTSVVPAVVQESTASEVDCGKKCPESLAKYDHDSRSWKTRQCSLEGGLIEFSENFPRWGSIRNGVLFRLPMPSGLKAVRALITSARESGSLLTLPTMNKCKASNDVNLNCSGDGRSKPNKLGWAIAETLRAPTPRKFDGSKGAVNATETTMQRVEDGQASLAEWIQETVRLPTIIHTEPRQGVQIRRPGKKGTQESLSTVVMRLPTMHGMSKDGKTNGPSGNELGRAINLLTHTHTHTHTHTQREFKQ